MVHAPLFFIMFRYIYIYVFILISFLYKAQNIIVNGNFEHYNNLYCNGAGFDVTYWNYLNSPDYYNTNCSSVSGGGVPSNMFGYCNSKNGNAYAGIGVFDFRFNYQEYVYQHLTSPLKADSIYCLSFYITRADRFPYAIKQIGAFFSNNQPILSSGYINASPQIVNNSGFLTDTINWIEIQGCFTAQGGEEYITIGNFNSNSNTDTIRIQSTYPLTGTGTDVAYYYIDSVSLWKNNFPTGVHEMNEVGKFMLYPNPNNGNMILEYDLGNAKEATMSLFDITGKLMLKENLTNTDNQINMNVNKFENGVYFYSIYINEKNIKTDKIIVIK